MFEMARPKGLMELCKFKDLICPTALNPFIEYWKVFGALSNLKCSAILAKVDPGGYPPFLSYPIHAIPADILAPYLTV